MSDPVDNKDREVQSEQSMHAATSGSSKNSPALAELYREAVITHAAEPIGYEQDIRPTHRCELYNPLCGDRVEVQFHVVGELIQAAAFHGESCAICMASASMLCEAMPGRAVTQLGEQHEQLAAALNNANLQPGLESLMALLEVRRYPARVKCALLPWEAAAKALKPDL